ncbi:hypothetical protein BY458DRAFT_515155 [Sporodiniella umbellata]|nr:hypothetical protein BY458DRAFT_515155 [Sporodiniella umbellata]
MSRRFEVKVEIVLDDEKKYFPGDRVTGKILLTSNRAHTLQKLWIAWTGRIHVQPKENEKADETYFSECWKLSPPVFKSSERLPKGGSLYHTALEPFTQQEEVYEEHPVLLELAKNKTVGFEFKLKVPAMPLPSSIGTGFPAHRISYVLEAFTGTVDVFYRQKLVPVYERIPVDQPEMVLPQRIERSYSVLTSQNVNCNASMQVIVPCQGHVPGTTIPIALTIHSNVAISRKQGISVSLLRTHQVIVDDRTFSSFAESISRSVEDLVLAEAMGTTQTAQVMLHIPKETVPTISIEQSRLMSVTYFIRILVYAHEGVYVSLDYQESQYLSAEIPFTIGTIKEPGLPTSPTHTDRTLEGIKNHPSIETVRAPSPSQSTSTRTSPSGEENKKSVSHLFRKSSGKNAVEGKKKNMFSHLWPGRRTRQKEELERNDASSSETQEKIIPQTPAKPEGIIRYRPFMDSDSEDESSAVLAMTTPLEDLRLNKPDEIIDPPSQLQKPHMKETTA